MNKIHDVNWQNVKKTVVRAPQIITKRSELVEKDAKFMELLVTLEFIEKQFNKFAKEVQRTNKHVKSMLESSKGLASQFYLIYGLESSDLLKEIGLTGNDDTHAVEQSNTYEEYGDRKELADKYLQILTDMSPAIVTELDLLQGKIEKTSGSILELAKNIRGHIKNREFELLDMDKHRTNVDKMEKKSELTIKQEENLIYTREKLEQSSANFAKLDNELKLELPVFFKLVYQTIDPLLQIVYWSYNIISYQFYQIMNSMEYEKVPVSEILQEFHKQTAVVVQDINALKIVNFNKNYSSALTKEWEPHSSFSDHDTSEQDVHQDVYQEHVDHVEQVESGQSLHATVLYDYEAQEEDELALHEGDVVHVLNNNDTDWWEGEVHGKRGIFPANYVELNPTTRTRNLV